MRRSRLYCYFTLARIVQNVLKKNYVGLKWRHFGFLIPVTSFFYLTTNFAYRLSLACFVFESFGGGYPPSPVGARLAQTPSVRGLNFMCVCVCVLSVVLYATVFRRQTPRCSGIPHAVGVIWRGLCKYLSYLFHGCLMNSTWKNNIFPDCSLYQGVII